MGEWDTHGFRAHFDGQNEVDIGTCSKRFCFSLDECFFGRKIVSFEPLSMAGKATRCTMEKALLGFGTSATSAK